MANCAKKTSFRTALACNHFRIIIKHGSASRMANLARVHGLQSMRPRSGCHPLHGSTPKAILKPMHCGKAYRPGRALTEVTGWCAADGSCIAGKHSRGWHDLRDTMPISLSIGPASSYKTDQKRLASHPSSASPRTFSALGPFLKFRRSKLIRKTWASCSRRLPYLLGTPFVAHVRPSGPRTCPKCARQ